MFTAKVIADGRLFMGQLEKGTWRDAYMLEPEKEYYGLVFDSTPTRTPYIEYSNAEPAFFKSEELEDVPGDLRLIPIGRKV
jgi:hypothetical protein